MSHLDVIRRPSPHFWRSTSTSNFLDRDLNTVSSTSDDEPGSGRGEKGEVWRDERREGHAASRLGMGFFGMWGPPHAHGVDAKSPPQGDRDGDRSLGGKDDVEDRFWRGGRVEGGSSWDRPAAKFSVIMERSRGVE